MGACKKVLKTIFDENRAFILTRSYGMSAAASTEKKKWIEDGLLRSTSEKFVLNFPAFFQYSCTAFNVTKPRTSFWKRAIKRRCDGLASQSNLTPLSSIV